MGQLLILTPLANADTLDPIPHLYAHTVSKFLRVRPDRRADALPGARDVDLSHISTRSSPVVAVSEQFCDVPSTVSACSPSLASLRQTSQERELWTFVNMNLAIVYLRMGRQSDFLGLLDRISPESLPSQSHSLRAASYYVQGLHGFFQRAFNDAKWVSHVRRRQSVTRVSGPGDSRKC